MIQSVITEEESDGYHKVFVDGLENCMEMLECLERGELDHCFIEANVCDGGCIKGPASDQWQNSFVKAKVQIEAQVNMHPLLRIFHMIAYQCKKHFWIAVSTNKFRQKRN